MNQLSDDRPSMLGKYPIIAVRGRGGMGIVYVADHPNLQKRVAIKVIHPERANSPQFRHEFITEAKAMAKVDSPHVVVVHDADEDKDGRLFLVMEFVDGVPLTKLLKTGQALVAKEAVTIALDIAKGLAAVHGHGMVHGDLSPGNVLVRRSEPHVSKLTDFGLSKFFGDQTRGLGRGTVGFRSLEHVTLGVPVEAPRDIWSFGAILFRMLAGRKRYFDDTEPLSFPTRPPVPHHLQQLCRECLDSNPDRRPPAASIVRAMERYQTRWRRWIRNGLAAILVICALALAILTWGYSTAKDEIAKERNTSAQVGKQLEHSLRQRETELFIELAASYANATMTRITLNRHPNDPIVKRNLDQIKRWLTHLETSTKGLDKRRDVELVLAYARYGVVEGRYTDTIQWLTAAVQEQAEQMGLGGKVHETLGDASCGIGDKSKALWHYEVAAKSNPRNWLVRLKVAWSLYQLGRRAQAIAAFTLFIDAQPPNQGESLIVAYFFRGMANVASFADPDKAWVDFDRVVSRVRFGDDAFKDQLYTAALALRAACGLSSRDQVRQVQAIQYYKNIIIAHRDNAAKGIEPHSLIFADTVCKLATHLPAKDGLALCDEAAKPLTRAKLAANTDIHGRLSFARGVLQMRQGEWHSAIDELQRAWKGLLPLEPANGQDELRNTLVLTKVNIAKCFFQLKNCTQAIDEIGGALPFLDKLVKSYNRKGFASWLEFYFWRGKAFVCRAGEFDMIPIPLFADCDYAAAIADYTTIIKELGPAFDQADRTQAFYLVSALFNRFCIYGLKDRDSEALADAKEGAAIGQRYLEQENDVLRLRLFGRMVGEMHLFVGLALHRQNAHQNAQVIVDHIERAGQLGIVGASTETPLEVIACAYCELGRIDEAITRQKMAAQKAKGTNREAHQNELLNKYQRMKRMKELSEK